MPKCSEVWNDFGSPYTEEGHSQKRRKCNHCGHSVNNNTRNAQTHLINCKTAPRTIGWLAPELPLNNQANSSTGSRSLYSGSSGISVPDDVGQIASALQLDLPKPKPSRERKKTQFVQPRLAGVVRDIVSPQMRKTLEKKLARAINASSMAFDTFSSPEWAEFFAELRPGIT